MDYHLRIFQESQQKTFPQMQKLNNNSKCQFQESLFEPAGNNLYIQFYPLHEQNFQFDRNPFDTEYQNFENKTEQYGNEKKILFQTSDMFKTSLSPYNSEIVSRMNLENSEITPSFPNVNSKKQMAKKLKRAKQINLNVGEKRQSQRRAANFRERKRMKSINDAFEGTFPFLILIVISLT